MLVNKKNLNCGYGEDFVEIIGPLDKEIYAIDYIHAHKYVMGEEDTVPELEIYDSNLHITMFKKNDHKSMLEYSALIKYQIILK